MNITPTCVPGEGSFLGESEEDKDLKLLNAKKMVELHRRLSVASPGKTEQKEKSSREIVLEHLTERGDEVLYAAEAAYPKEMATIVHRLAQLISQGQISKITGGELLRVLRSIGMRVSVRTSISVSEHGKVVSLADKLKVSD
jgi:DNA-binding TFAR19-related protein (PDSD5 family)